MADNDFLQHSKQLAERMLNVPNPKKMLSISGGGYQCPDSITDPI
jgi:hypothetical protein